jgi:hypothetical protein
VAWVIWFWLLIRCFADIFRPARPRAGAKVLWMIFLIVLPFSACSLFDRAERGDGRA